MSRTRFSAIILFVTIFAFYGEARAQSATAYGPAYSVAEYDTLRNPAEDLQATIRQAQEEGKRILMEVGGEWCTWCHALDRYVRDNQAVAQALREGFIIMKVNFSPENLNEAFLAQYPKISAYPHIFILDSDGTFLHSQDVAVLEQGRSYNHDVFMAFLERWAPER